MLCLKGYNRLLKKWIEMKILDDGTVLADDGNISKRAALNVTQSKWIWERKCCGKTIRLLICKPENV